MKTCSNCGGSFDEKLPKCPYCGMINEDAAENEYNDQLDNIRKKLDNVDELAVADYKGDLKTFLKIFFVTLIVAGGITFLTVSARYARKNGFLEDERAKMDETIATIRTQRSYTDKWDVLYDEGKYEELCKQAKELTGDRYLNFYEWPHNNFVNAYDSFVAAYEKIDEVAAKETPSRTDRTGALQAVLYTYYSAVSSRKNDRFTEAEQQLFDEKWEDLVKKTCETFDMTEHELDTLRIKAGADSYPSYSEVSAYVKERWGE
ncbi:MAG: hypothetical protein J5626_02395 [Lachnospiraceae bacterium]|nr:hypothetical protein [Lachnospiraceae bacterium]